MSEYEPLTDDGFSELQERVAAHGVESVTFDEFAQMCQEICALKADRDNLRNTMNTIAETEQPHAEEVMRLHVRIRTLEAERDRLRSACSAVAEADPADSFRWHQRNCRAALRSPEDTDTEGE